MLWLVLSCLVSTVKGRQVDLPAKIIQTKDGDVFECNSIYKQSTFKDPLFKDHKVQMWPSWFDPKLLSEEDKQKIKSAQIGSLDEECPEGAVPVLRLPKNQTYGAQPSLISPTSVAYGPQSLGPPDEYWAFRQVQANDDMYYGATAEITAYGLDVGKNQLSTNMVWVVKEDAPFPGNVSAISAGCGAYPDLLGDSRNRFIIFWSVKGTSCYNDACPGFILVSKQIPLGVAIWPLSTIHGHLYSITLHISKDMQTGHWWLAFNDPKNFIGYWHKDAFPSDAMDHGTRVDLGGFVSCPSGQACPPMGSGIHPRDDWHGSSFMQRIRVMHDQNDWWEVLEEDQNALVKSPDCYDVSSYGFGGGDVPVGFRFHYGGSSDGKICQRKT